MAYHIGRPKEKIAIVEVKNGSSINDIAGINKTAYMFTTLNLFYISF